MQERGITRLTGEGERHGATPKNIAEDGISVTTSFPIADAYAGLNTENYLNREQLPANHPDVFPVIFGLKDVPHLREEIHSDLYSFRTDHEIDLRKKVSIVYVPEQDIGHTRNLLASLDMNKRVILPIEGVKLLLKMDPDHEREFRRAEEQAGTIKFIESAPFEIKFS